MSCTGREIFAVSLEVNFIFQHDHVHGAVADGVLIFTLTFLRIVHEQVASVVSCMHHVRLLELLHYFILPMIKCHKEHVHVLEARSLRVKL